MEYEEFVVDLNADCKCGCMEGDRFHKIYRFPNGFGASVVNNPKMKGFDSEGYRVLIIRFSPDGEYRVVNLMDFSRDELDCGSWDDVVRTLTRIKGLGDSDV